MTEIGRITVVVYVLDQFVYVKLQLTDNGVFLCYYFSSFHSASVRGYG